MLGAGTFMWTNQRVCFRMSMTGISMVEFLLPEVKGFWVTKGLFASAVTISGKSRDKFKFTNFSVKKLEDWLQQAGIPKLT